MTGILAGLEPDSFMLPGAGIEMPEPANDNQPGVKGGQGFMGLLLRRAGSGTDDGYEILLCHRDPGLSQRVETAADDTDIIALWRSIGRKLNLPLFAETAGGEIIQIEPNPCLIAAPRRGGSQMASRRPRFLARRKVGHVVPAKRPAVQKAR